MSFLTLKTCFTAQQKSVPKTTKFYQFSNISAKSNEQIGLFDQKTTTFSCFCAKIITNGESYFFLGHSINVHIVHCPVNDSPTLDTSIVASLLLYIYINNCASVFSDAFY